jgi:hypothetical protein
VPPTTGSMLASTFLLAGSQALGILTAPGPKRGTFNDLAYNPGGAASVIPYICGTVETIPHLVNYFDYATKKVKNDVAIEDILMMAGLDGLAGYVSGGGTFGIAGAPDPPTAYQGLAVGAVLGAIVGGLGSVRTASYRHYCGFFYEICHGRIDGISIVKVDERPVASGNDSNAGNTILLDDPYAWGGDHVDGGVYAVCDIVAGDFWPTQQPNSYLVAQLGATVPAYQGKACFIIRGPSGFTESGYFAANPGAAPALRPLKLRVHRYPNNLGVPAYKKVNVSGYNADANIAECCYEWLTSASFGVKKLSASRIDVDSFRAGAQTHFNEGLGVSLEFNSAVDVETALDTFSQLGDVVIFGGFRTGTIKYKVIRRDYSIPALDVFRRGADGSNPDDYNVVSAEGFTPGTWAATANMFQFEYIDRDNNFARTTRYAQDLSNRMLTGQTRSLIQSLEGVSNGAEAALVATREMRAGSYPRPPLTLTTNREAYAKEPGDVIKYIDNVDGYTKILRIAEVQGGAEDNSEIKLICVEDQYGVGSSAYAPYVPPVWEDPVGTPAAAALAKVIEAPYYLTRDDDARLLAFAAKPNNAQLDFDTYISVDAGATYALDSSHTDFAITGTITQAVARLTAAVMTSLTFTPASAFEASRLTSATPTQIAANQNILYWEATGEFMAVETITDNGDGTFTLTNIWRAVHPYDSVPTPQAAGATVWFFTYGRTVSNAEFVAATATRTKILPRTVSATLPLADATSVNVTVGTRSLKPNPVRNVLLNTGYLTADIGASDDVRVDWNESNRLMEGSVIKQTQTGVAPEATSTYTVRWYATETTSVLLRTESGIVAATGTQTATMTTAEEIASANYLGHLSAVYRVEIDVVRGGNTSTTYIRELTRAGGVVAPPPGDVLLAESSDYLHTEASEYIELDAVAAAPSPTWTAKVGVSESPTGKLTKTASSGWGNAGAVSVESFTGNCRLSYYWRTPFQNNKMIGIGSDVSCVSYSTIDFGENLELSGGNHNAASYANGSSVGSQNVANDASGHIGTLIEIERVGTTVSAYYTPYTVTPPVPGAVGRTLFKTFAASSSGAIYVNVAIDVNGTVFDAADMTWGAI